MLLASPAFIGVGAALVPGGPSYFASPPAVKDSVYNEHMKKQYIYTLARLDIWPDELDPLQIAIFWAMRARSLESSPVTLGSLAADLGRERSSLHRALVGLLSAGIVCKCA